MTDTLQTQVHGQIHENTSEFPNKFLYMYMDNLLVQFTSITQFCYLYLMILLL